VPKEIFGCGKIDQSICKKRPMNMQKETYHRENMQKENYHVGNMACQYGKRGL